MLPGKHVRSIYILFTCLFNIQLATTNNVKMVGITSIIANKKPLKKWPSLERLLEESKRIKLETYTEKLLEPIEHFALDDGSDISEISDVFEEFHQNSFLKRQKGKKKYLTKQEADIKTMEQFTDDYKAIMKKLEEGITNDKPLGSEIFEDLEKHVTVLKSSTKESDNRKIEDIIAPIVGKPKSDITPRKDSDRTEESTTWNVIDAHTRDKPFEISPLGYNAFQGRKHWLERPNVEWSRINTSKLKVEKWLQKSSE